MTKRIFAMVLAVCMTLTLLPVSALAARSSREDQPLAEVAKGEEILDRAEEAAAKPAAAEGDALADGEITDSNQPGAFIQARDGKDARYFTNLKYALDAATDGDTVVLKMGSKTFAEVMGSDAEYVVRQSDLTIDLGGNTVNDVPNYKLILAGQGITLQRGTLNGAYTTDSLATTGKVSYVLVTNGNNTKLNDLTTLGGISVSGGSATLTEVNATGTNYYAVCAQVGADVTIESGTYQKLGLAEGQGYQANSVLWVESGSTMVIHGGTFTAAEGGNIVLKGHRAPTISGGTFNRDMTAENATLAEGFEQKQENGGWTVTEKPKPEVGPAAKNDWGTEYDTLQEAINAAEENSTICHNIYLLRNVTEDVTVDGNRTVQIGLGNSDKENYTLTTVITVKNGSFLRLMDYNYGTKVTDTETWAAKHGDQPIVTVEAGGEFELSQGGMKGTGAVIQNNGGTVTLAQESWLDGTVTGSVARIAYDAKLSETAKNSIGEVSGKEWLNTAAPGSDEGNWYISGTAAIEVGDRRYGYQDLQLAIDQAGENETVKLLSNVTASVTVGADKKIILDLNGKKLEGAKPGVKNQDPTLKNLGTLTITGNGTVKANSNSRFDGDTVVNEGKLTVESGKFQTKTGHVSLKNNVDKANVIVKNGTFAEDISGIATPGEGLEFAEDGKTVVKAKAAQITKGETVTKYETLADAITAAEAGDTVTLLENVALTAFQKIAKNITLDLGSYNITGGSSNYTLVTAGNVTLTGSGTICNGTMKNAIQHSAGTLTVNGPTIKANADTSSSTGGTGILISNAGGTVNVVSGTIEGRRGISLSTKSATVNVSDGTVTGSQYGIYAAASNANPIGTINVSGGTVKCDAKTGVFAKNATVNLTGGTVSGQTGVDMQGGTITVSEGALVNAEGYGISLQNQTVADASTAAKLIMTGGAVKANTTNGQAICGNNLYSQGTVASISGGTVTGGTGVYWPMGGTLTVSGDAQIEGTLAGIEAKQGTINITGGTVKATGDYVEYAPSGNGTVGSGWALAVSTQQYATTVEGVSSDVVVSITGGELISEKGTGIETINMGLKETDGSISVSGNARVIAAERKDAIHTASGNVAVAGDKNVALTVSGGTFSTDVSDYCVEGFKAQMKDDGSYGIVAKTVVAQITREGVDEPLKFYTLQEAIAAAGANDTVKVLKDVALTKSIDPDKSITIEGVTKEDGSKPVISGDKGLFSITQGSATLKNLELQATGNTWYIYQETELTVDSCDFTMADGVTEVGNLIMDDGHGKVTFTNNHVLAHSRVALAGPGNDSVITNNVFDLVNEHYGTSRASVIGLVATEASGDIVITGNTFKNANRVLGVDNSYAKVADKLTFKNNSFIDCRWTLELDPNTQSGFDLSENYYCFNNTVGMPRVENAASSGSHFEFGNETGTEYVLTDTNSAVEVNSYYTDADRKELVTIAAQLIAMADGAVTAYATIGEALAASKPGDTLKVLTLDETVVDGQFAAIEIPDGKAVQLVCGEELAAAFREQNIDPAVYLPAYFTYQARTRSNGGRNAFTLYGGVESTLTGENAIRTKGAANGTTFGVTIVDLLQNWTLKGNVTLPSRDATTTPIYALADVTIDLDGHTLEQEASARRDPLTQNCTTAGWDGSPAVIAYNGKTVTVKDSSTAQTGKVIGSAQTFDVYPGATLNLESGTFTTKGNWYNANNYGGFGSIVRMDGGTLNVSGGKLTIPEDNAAHSVKMAATIMLRGKVAENPTRAYAINITGGVIGTVPESKRAPESFKTVYSQTDGFVAINLPVITDETNPNGKNITYSITGGTFDMELQGAKDATEKPYLGEGYVSPEDEENEDHFVVKACDHADVTVTREDEHDATCTEDGSYVEVTTCNTCGNVTREAKTSEKLGHNTDGVVEHKDATCTEDGVVGGVYCTRCNDGKEAAETAIGKLGHDLTKWAHDDVNHWHVCSRCDADVTDTPAAHVWVQGTVSGGQRTDTCECGAERTVSVSTGGNNRPRPTPPEEDLNEPDVPLVEKPFLFTDVTADDWYYDAVKYVSAANMMIGVNAEGTLFAPALSTTRASVAQILFRLEKEPTAPIADFDDVREGAWYTDAVNWNDEVGLMIGYGDGTFRPDVNVTREQLVTVLYRYAKHLGLDVTADGDLSAFDDADEVAAWAEDAMAWAVNVGIIKGRNGTRLAPDGTASRSELASILQRFQKLTAAEKD